MESPDPTKPTNFPNHLTDQNNTTIFFVLNLFSHNTAYFSYKQCNSLLLAPQRGVDKMCHHHNNFSAPLIAIDWILQVFPTGLRPLYVVKNTLDKFSFQYWHNRSTKLQSQTSLKVMLTTFCSKQPGACINSLKRNAKQNHCCSHFFQHFKITWLIPSNHKVEFDHVQQGLDLEGQVDILNVVFELCRERMNMAQTEQVE